MRGGLVGGEDKDERMEGREICMNRRLGILLDEVGWSVLKSDHILARV